MKGWTKIKTRKGLSKWENDAGRFMYVTGSTSISGDKIYVVDSNHPQFWINARNFTTRQEAIDFANDFMKRHSKTSVGDIIFSQGVDLRTMRK